MGRLAKLLSVLGSTWQQASEKQIGLIAAGVAFFGMFGLFPGIAAIIAIFGLLADPTVVQEQAMLLQEFIPPDAYELFMQQISRLLGARTQTLGWATIVSIALALWAARAGVAALMGGLNAIAGRPPRNGIWQAIVALALTMSLVFLTIVALMVIVVAPILLAVLPLSGETAWMLEAVRWAVALAVPLFALALLYRFGPAPQGERGRWFTIGACVTIVLWIGGSWGLSFYLTNFASYNEVYGSIGAVIGLLMWLYASAYLVLLGAALNAQIHRKSATYR